MSDLFSTSVPKTSSYTAEDIEVLEGLEPVRHRPGMYIGGTDEAALHHLVMEILDNAMDEAVAGHASKIDVYLNEGNSVTIRDNGRGIPIDPHPKFPQKSALEVIMTTLHSGAKFSGKSYKTSGGLHGVGISVVNALSESMVIEVSKNKEVWIQEYAIGKPVTPLENHGRSSLRSGTQITFWPDPTIFQEVSQFKPETLYKMVRSKAYLYKGVTLHWHCAESLCPEGLEAEATFHFPGGLHDYLTEQLGDTPLATPTLFSGQASFNEIPGHMEWAIAWPLHAEGTCTSYCNTIPTPHGGTHENGFRQAIVRSLRTYGERIGNKKAAQLTADDAMAGATAVLSVFIQNPQFQGQTKEKLASHGIARSVEQTLRDHLDHWLIANPDSAQPLIEHVLHQMEDRLSRKHSKEVNRASATRKLRLPGKLADCSINEAKGTEIFLVEGDSAGGSAKQARERKTQAILPLRGKVLNVASATLEKMKANQEIANMIQAIGCGIGPACNVKDLRYERIIIMTDADVDGAHIASLLITFFFQQMKPIIEAGHLYLAQPPLYRLTQGSKSIYARDDADRERLLATEFKGAKKVDISRFKGLGEMPASQLKDTTMDPKKRVLQRVFLPSPDEEKDITKFVNDLMGRNPEKRFTYIQDNATFVRDLDL